MKVSWREGPPPSEGRWWIYFPYGAVYAVEIRSEVIRTGEEPVLLAQSLCDAAWILKAVQHLISHHAPLEVPEAPR